MVDLSVLICTWNNADRLGITLSALDNLSYPSGVSYEIIVVDNNSDDNTASVLRNWSTPANHHHLHEPRQGKSFALNTALSRSTGNLILFLDDDVEPSSDLVLAYWAAYLDRGDTHFFGGPIESVFEADALKEELVPFAPWSVKGLDWGTTDMQLDDPNCFIGSNWACAKEPILAVGGFDTNIGLNAKGPRVGEETRMMQLLNQSGLSPWYVSSAKIKHWIPRAKTTIEHIAHRCAESSRLEAQFRTDVTLESILRAFARVGICTVQYIYSRLVPSTRNTRYLILRQQQSRLRGMIENYPNLI